MSDRKQTQSDLSDARKQAKDAANAYKRAQAEWRKLLQATMDARAVADKAYIDLCTSEQVVKFLQRHLVQMPPAVTQAILEAPEPQAEPLNVEKIAAHLRYGASGRTRKELGKQLNGAMDKLREKLVR